MRFCSLPLTVSDLVRVYLVVVCVSDPPPSYDSLYGELKAAKAGSSGFLDFLKKFMIIVLSTSKCTSLIADFIYRNGFCSLSCSVA